MDVNTVFLRSDLEEDIYMVLPEGFIEFVKENLIYKLSKSLYNIKQAHRQ